MTQLTTKQIRNSVYQQVSSEGFSFNKARHKKLKQLLQGKVAEEEFVGDDEDTNLLPAEEE
jgi:hypothetical protein